ncbi:MAG: hypothetical protein AAF767_06200 [Pseudomonadota bacterium]
MTLQTACVRLIAIAMAASCAAFSATAWELNAESERAYVYAKDDAGPSLMLACSDQMGIQALVYLDGNAADELGLDGVRRLASRYVSVETETTEPRSDRWRFARSTRTLISIEPWQGRRIYNAVVTGSPVKMEISREGVFTLNLPPVNEAFKTFSKTCL